MGTARDGTVAWEHHGIFLPYWAWVALTRNRGMGTPRDGTVAWEQHVFLPTSSLGGSDLQYTALPQPTIYGRIEPIWNHPG